MRTLRFLLPYTRNYLAPLILTVVSMFALVGVQLLVPWIIRSLIGAVTDQSAWNAENMAFVTRLALILLGVFVARAALQFIRSYMAHVAGWGVVADARRHIYEHMQRLSLRFYEDMEGKRIVERGTHRELMAQNGLYRHLNVIQTEVERQWATAHTGPLAVTN